MATYQSNANIVSLGLASIQPFNSSGDPSNLSQRWCKWKKSFEYFLLASGINDEKRKRALLLHLIGADTQEVFETFSNTGEDYKTAMVKLDEYFDHKENVPFERHKFRKAEQESGESVDSVLHVSVNCQFIMNLVLRLKITSVISLLVNASKLILGGVC